MKLSEKLTQIRDAFSAKVPSEIKAVMHAATQALEQSGLADRAIGVGDSAPDFTLAGPSGDVSLSALRARGPVVLTWFRGTW